VVCVADATNLLRHLYLASQVADAGRPMVIALNMIDAAHEQGIAIDTRELSRRLGVPVVPTVAARGQGIDELRRAIDQAHQKDQRFTPTVWPQPVHRAIESLRAALPEAADGLTSAELNRMLFDPQSAVFDRLGMTGEQREAAVNGAYAILREQGLEPATVEPMIRYEQLATLTDGVVSRSQSRKATGTESIDGLLTHRLWGVVIFAALMFGVFWSIYTGATPLMDGIEAAFGALGDWAGAYLASMPMVQSLVVDGVIAGVGGVVVFLPQILILFFFIALLEDTGYMARAAFLMDKLFAWCGLSGKSFVPLLSCYACAVPGVLGARTIENPKARITTILIAPLMSCSARLPVYVLLISAFIQPIYGNTVAAATLFGMHLLGLLVALPIALVVNRLIFKVKRTPFIMEMPPYRVPRMRDVVWRMWLRGRDFLRTAGTVIFAMSVIIWALSYFPRPDAVAEQSRDAFTKQVAADQGVTHAEAADRIETDEALSAGLDNAISGAYLEQSALGRVGKAVQPVFAPAGFDWKLTVGVLGSFPAREVIIATLGILYNVGGDVAEDDPGLKAAMHSAAWPDGAAVFTIPVAIAVMVFFALCLQCGATVATIGREIGWKWAITAFVYMTALAWLGAVAAYQLGTAVAGA
jgi:ferrous iron transport protein B